MIKEAITKIQEMALKAAEAQIITDKYNQDHIKLGSELIRVNEKPDVKQQSTLSLNTLNGILDYINLGVDPEITSHLIHIESPTNVKVFEKLDFYKRRNCLIESTPIIPHFKYSQFMAADDFIIDVLSKFVPNDDFSELIDIVSHLKVEDGVTTEDNGISQKVTVQKGIEAKRSIIKTRFNLVPIRSFIEIPQPESEFVFRMKKTRENEIQCALFASDGELWRIDALASIKEWIEKGINPKLKDTVKIIM